jgi:hypothetical protein
MRTLAIKVLVVSLFLTVLASAQDVVGLRKLLALWPADGQASVELLDEVFHEIATIDPGGHSEFISKELLTELKRAGVPEAAALKALDARRYQRVEAVLKQVITERAVHWAEARRFGHAEGHPFAACP